MMVSTDMAYLNGDNGLAMAKEILQTNFNSNVDEKAVNIVI
jgi:hypothetical protein